MFSLDDTIAALATAPGRAALSIVRVSGPQTRSLLGRIAPKLPQTLEPRRALLASVVGASAEPIDTGLVVFFPGPDSYTGEDAAEVTVHGSPRVVDRLLEALTSGGARLAGPGEFTLRALVRGKMDLIEAEAVRELIEARTERAARACARRLAGALSARLCGVREALFSAAASLTATLDFAEDVGEDVDPRVCASLTAAVEDLARLARSYETGRLLSSGSRIAILGRPNAGKSTLFNALVGSPRAIVTDIPGTTRDALEATLDVSGIPVTVVDTAGLTATEDPVEAIGVARAREEAEKADAVLYVFDAALGLTGEDRAALAALGQKPVDLVANKIDTLPPGRPAPDAAVAVCGVGPGAGEALHAAVAARLSEGVALSEDGEMLGNARQRDLVERARRATQDAVAALSRGDSPEYASAHVNEALAVLSDVFGETTPGDVLERIFATFCIGK